MVFSSAVFLFLFLPVVILLHTVIKNNKIRNGLLIAASLIFYAYGEPVYIALLIGSVAVNYVFGRILSARKSKALLAASIVINIGLLVVFKYTGFIVQIINFIPVCNFKVPDITMPIGISFYTFQAISYIVDVYRKEEREDVGFFDVLLYISLFPQLIAGPIVKFNSIKDRIKSRNVTLDGLAHGIRKFIIGLSKKMLLANSFAYVADSVFSMNTSAIDMRLAWLGAVCYTLQIFFDFSGYSDMALGLGSMMGFDFPQNFNYPYTACSVRDFWRRWHMSLTSWFREYLYIPLGGNRRGPGRKILNTMIVFICTGIWHGANFTFLIWGILHGVFMCIETIVTKDKKDVGKHFNALAYIYTMLVVIIGFVIFRADSTGYAFSYIGRMFSFTSLSSSFTVFMGFLTPVFIVTAIAGIIACTPVVPYISAAVKDRKLRTFLNGLSYVAVGAILVLCIMGLAADSYNPFIYFRF